jgi:hypothetical protein
MVQVSAAIGELRPGAEDDDDFVEKFGPYKLVARFIKGQHHGILWREEAEKPAIKLVALTAASNLEAKALVERRFYELCLARRDADGSGTLTDEEVLKAWMYVWPHLNDGQKAMIRTQFHAPQRRLSTLQLADVAGYKSHGGVNLWYGKAGFMFFGEAAQPIEERNKQGNPVFSFALSTGADRALSPNHKNWVWEMRPHVARGLEMSGVLNN